MKCPPVVALLALFCTLAPPAIARQKSKVKPEVLAVGQPAPPIGDIGWVELGGEAKQVVTDVAALRGRVVVIADYGYYCDSCIRVGVPLMRALRASNDSAELIVIPLTAGIGDDTSETIQAKGKSLGLTGVVGVTDVEGQGSPYLDMNANGNLTYAFVIGRHGGIVWRGDPSRKRDGYMAAVSSAMHAVPCEPLPTDSSAFGAEVAPALRDYVLGDFSQAETGARSLIKKLGTKTGVDADRVRSEATALVALVEATRKHLMDELEGAHGAQDAERFQRALIHVRRAFPKGPESERGGSLMVSFTAQSDQERNCRLWAEWFALEAARPATFPAEKDPACAKYARQLITYAKQPGVPGLERANAWLAANEKAVARK